MKEQPRGMARQRGETRPAPALTDTRPPARRTIAETKT